MPFDRRSGGRPGGGRPRQGGGFPQNREMHKAVCSECGAECEVPFKPTDGRPVFCKDCFAKNRKY